MMKINKLLFLLLLHVAHGCAMEPSQPTESPSWFSRAASKMYALLPEWVQNKRHDRWNKKLLEAAGDGDVELIKKCLAHGADVNTTCLYSGPKVPERKELCLTPLGFALIENDYDVAQLLIKHGGRKVGSRFVLTRFFVRCGDKKLAALLVKSRIVNVSWPDHELRMALNYLLSVGSSYLIPALIAQCSDVNVADRSGRTLLHEGVEVKSPGIVISSLLLCGASLSAQDKWGQTPFHLLTEKHDFFEILRYVQSPAGIDDQKHKAIQENLFTLLCCLKRLTPMPRDVRKMIELYTISAEAGWPLFNTLSVAQLGWLVKRKLFLESEVLDRLVERHFATIGQALSTENHDGHTPHQRVVIRKLPTYKGCMLPHKAPKQNDYLEPDMKALKVDHGAEIRERYQRVLHGLPQEEKEPDDENK